MTLLADLYAVMFILLFYTGDRQKSAEFRVQRVNGSACRLA